MAIYLDQFGNITVSSGGGDVSRAEFDALALRVTTAEGTLTGHGQTISVLSGMCNILSERINDHDTRIAVLESYVAPDLVQLQQQMIFFHASGWQTFTDDMVCGNWDTEGFPVDWVFGDYNSNGLLLKFN